MARSGSGGGAAGAPEATGPQHRNEVLLVGRLAAAAKPLTLPSGDELSTWRLVVARVDGPTSTSAVRRPTVDTILRRLGRAGAPQRQRLGSG